MLVDSHCHLDDAQFLNDRADVLARATAAGVGYMLSIGTGNGPPDLECAVRQAEQHPFVYATVGIHPNDAEKSTPATFVHLEQLLQHRKVRAVGEIGLDYHWAVARDVQMSVFLKQLEIAAAASMPVVIHTRDSWADTLAVLRERWARTGLDCVLHCFTGGVEEAKAGLDLGCTLAFGGVTTFPKAAAVREAARVTPMERLLLETDSPYLAPVPYRGKRNEPAFVAKTAALIAELRGVSLEELGSQTTHNFWRIFGVSGESGEAPGSASDQETNTR